MKHRGRHLGVGRLPLCQQSLRMKLEEDFELLESPFLGLNPLVASRVPLAVYRWGDRYVLLETAPRPATASSGSPRRTRS